MSVLVRTRAELAHARRNLPGAVALVPTMGALHAGHDALIRAARDAAASVIVSIFVNPMQFDRDADLQRYPRVLRDDLERCRELGVDLVWAPEVSDVYPNGAVGVRVSAGDLGTDLEGRSRPGHFDGVLTVVAKLFGLIRPDQAFFGEKDYQQLMLVTQMVSDLELGVDVTGVSTVRDPDGLALSSRNVFLSDAQRRVALSIPAALQAARLAERTTPAAVLAAAAAELAATPGLSLDYLQLRGDRLQADPVVGPARLLIAARIGETRLIDNCALELSDAPSAQAATTTAGGRA